MPRQVTLGDLQARSFQLVDGASDRFQLWVGPGPDGQCTQLWWDSTTQRAYLSDGNAPDPVALVRSLLTIYAAVDTMLTAFPLAAMDAPKKALVRSQMGVAIRDVVLP